MTPLRLRAARVHSADALFLGVIGVLALAVITVLAFTSEPVQGNLGGRGVGISMCEQARDNSWSVPDWCEDMPGFQP